MEASKSFHGTKVQKVNNHSVRLRNMIKLRKWFLSHNSKHIIMFKSFVFNSFIIFSIYPNVHVIKLPEILLLGYSLISKYV